MDETWEFMRENFRFMTEMDDVKNEQDRMDIITDLAEDEELNSEIFELIRLKAIMYKTVRRNSQ